MTEELRYRVPRLPDRHLARFPDGHQRSQGCGILRRVDQFDGSRPLRSITGLQVADRLSEQQSIGGDDGDRPNGVERMLPSTARQRIMQQEPSFVAVAGEPFGQLVVSQCLPRRLPRKSANHVGPAVDGQVFER